MNKVFNIDLFSDYKLVYPLVIIVLMISLTNGFLISIFITTLLIFYLVYGKRFIIFFMLASFIIFPREVSPTLRFVLQVFNYIIITILFLQLYGLNFKSYPHIPRNIMYFLFSIVFLMLISTIHSDYFILGIEKVILTILFFFLTYLLYALIRTKEDVKLLLVSLFICSLISLALLFNEALHYKLDLINLYQKVFLSEEFYYGKNTIGILFSISIIFITSYLFSDKCHNRKYYYIVLTTLVIGLLITNSRASLVCLLLGIMTIIYIMNRKILFYSLIVIGMLFVILSLTPLYDEIMLYLRISSLGSGREYLIGATLEVIKNNIILGVGPAGTRSELYANLPYMLHSPEEWVISVIYKLGDLNQTHNFYLYLIADLGIGGFILSVLLPIIYFYNCYKVYQELSARNDTNFYIVLGLIGTGIYYFTRGFVEQMNIFSYGAIYYDLPFWILLSILAYYYKKYVGV